MIETDTDMGRLVFLAVLGALLIWTIGALGVLWMVERSLKRMREALVALDRRRRL